jgi:hypothetical protein
MADEKDDTANKTFNVAKLGRFVKSGKTGKELQEASAARKDAAKAALDKDPKSEKLKSALTEASAEATAASKVPSNALGGKVYQHIYGPDGSDAKGNAGFTISFQHVPSERTVYFKAFLTAFNETFKPEWAVETVYGRADPIYMFKSIVRTISVGLMVPAATEGEGFENLGKVQDLIQFLYPSYTDPTNALSITQSPLVRLKVMNLATRGSAGDQGSMTNAEAMPQAPQQLFNSNKAEDGLMGEIGNLTINHNVENTDLGSFEINKGTIIPKAIELQFDFTVIHEHHLGWDKEDNFSAPYFPYDLDLYGDEQRKKDEAKAKAALVETARVEAERAAALAKAKLAQEAAQAKKAAEMKAKLEAMRQQVEANKARLKSILDVKMDSGINPANNMVIGEGWTHPASDIFESGDDEGRINPEGLTDDFSDLPEDFVRGN